MRSAKQRHQFAGLVERTNRKRNHDRKRAALGRKLNMPKDKAGMRQALLAEYDKMGMLWDAALIEAFYKVATRK